MISAAVMRSTAANSTATLSEAVLALAYLGEHLRRGLSGKTDRCRDRRIVGPQEDVGAFLLAELARDGRRARGDLLFRFGLARLERGIAGLDRERKADIGVGIFVAAVHRGVVGQRAELEERLPHLLRLAF